MRGIHAEGSLCALWCEDSEPAASSLLSHRQIWEIPKDAEEGEGVACAAGGRGEMAGGRREREKSVRGKGRKRGRL